jgi:hypothetical protein
MFRRLSIDFALALLIFYVGVATFAGHRDHASIVGPARLTTPPLMEYYVNIPGYVELVGNRANITRTQSPHQRLTFALLAVTFAAMTAFNLAIWRHVLRVYPRPKRQIRRI